MAAAFIYLNCRQTYYLLKFSATRGVYSRETSLLLHLDFARSNIPRKSDAWHLIAKAGCSSYCWGFFSACLQPEQQSAGPRALAAVVFIREEGSWVAVCTPRPISRRLCAYRQEKRSCSCSMSPSGLWAHQVPSWWVDFHGPVKFGGHGVSSSYGVDINRFKLVDV